MTNTISLDEIADAWTDLQRDYWDGLSALTASGPIADCEEALERQVLLFRRLGGAIIKLRAACMQAGLRGLEQTGDTLQLSREQLEEIRKNTESWIENEQRALAGWVDTASALCLGTACKDLPVATEAPFPLRGAAADRLLDLQSICLEALRPPRNSDRPAALPDGRGRALNP